MNINLNKPSTVIPTTVTSADTQAMHQLADLKSVRERVASLRKAAGESKALAFKKQGDFVSSKLTTYVTAIEDMLTSQEPQQYTAEELTAELNDAKELLRAYDPATNSYAKLSKKVGEYSESLREIKSSKVELTRLEGARAYVGEAAERLGAILAGEELATTGTRGRINTKKVSAAQLKTPEARVNNLVAMGHSEAEAKAMVKADDAQAIDAVVVTIE